MSVRDIINSIDLDVLREQSNSIENQIENIEEDLQGSISEEVENRLSLDKKNLTNLLSFLDALILAIEDE